MKKFFGIIGAAMVAVMLTGCMEPSTYKPVEVNMAGNEPIKRPPATQTTTAGTSTSSSSSSSSSTEAAKPSSDPLKLEGVPAVSKPVTITKAKIDRTISTSAVFVYQGREWVGTLELNEKGFTFTPENGQIVEFPLNAIMLVVAGNKEDQTNKTLGIIVNDQAYEFSVDGGFVEEISEYIIVGHATGEYLK